MAIYINKLDMAAFKQLVLYGIFGVLTTLINIFTYWLMSRIFGVAVVPATIIAWTVAVLFAYCTNRKYVFHSSENSIAGIIHESFMFFMCRIGTGLLDVVIMYIFADLLKFDDVIVKILSDIIVIILNYVASKIFIFKK